MKKLDRNFGNWLLFHTFEYWYYYIGGFVSLYALNYIQSEIPGLTKELADLMKNDSIEEFNLYYFLLLAICILFFRTSSRLLFFYPARIQQKFLRIELLDKVERALPRSYASYSGGELFNLLFNDLNRLRAVMGFALLQIANLIVAAFVFIPKLMAFNGDFIMAFSPMVMCLVIFSISMVFIHPIGLRQMKQYGEVQNFMLESYQAKHTIKNFKKEESLISSFRGACWKELKLFYKVDFSQTVFSNLIKLGVAISLMWAAMIVYDSNLPSSDLIYFSGFLFLILEPLMFMSWIGVVFSNGYGSWRRLKKFTKNLDYARYQNFQVSNDFQLKLWGKDEVFQVRESRWTVLIGDTGVGKSHVLEQISIELYRNNRDYSFIQQEPFIYNDTVSNNIFLALERTPKREQKVREYIKAFGLDVLAESTDEVLSMELGEQGKKISGGQAKRVALIRSLIADTPVVIWDDPFSSVDLILEDQILSYMKTDADLKDKTFIFSSHRLSTIRNCHEIIFISKDNGIIEQGRTDQLLNNASKTSEYVKKQLV